MPFAAIFALLVMGPFSRADEHPVGSGGWCQLGRNQLNRHEFTQAQISAREAIRANPRYSPAYKLLGEADRELNDYQGAYRAWLEANKLDPRDTQVTYYLGRLFFEAGQLNEAAAWFRETLKSVPSHFAAQTYLGLSAEGMGMSDTAARLYRSAVDESKTQRKPLPLAFLSLAQLIRRQGDETGALALLEEGERLCPDGRLLTALGALLTADGETARAEAVLRRAITMDATIPEAHYRLSLLLKSQGRASEAKVEMDRFLQAKSSTSADQVLAVRN